MQQQCVRPAAVLQQQQAPLPTPPSPSPPSPPPPPAQMEVDEESALPLPLPPLREIPPTHDTSDYLVSEIKKY